MPEENAIASPILRRLSFGRRESDKVGSRPQIPKMQTPTDPSRSAKIKNKYGPGTKNVPRISEPISDTNAISGRSGRTARTSGIRLEEGGEAGRAERDVTDDFSKRRPGGFDARVQGRFSNPEGAGSLDRTLGPDGV